MVPARNEEAGIAVCVASILSQDVDLELLVVDDGSTDGTAALVRDIAASDPRLTLLPAPQLPEGWVGKNHAVAFAARRARSDWLLFTDADTVHLPGSLRRSLEEAGEYDVYSLSPEQETRTWWEMAVIPRIYSELERLYAFAEINRPVTLAAAANGQFILIRRTVYEALGGHAALAGEILEDVALARAAKRAGFRLHFTSGAGRVRTRMYRSLAAMWEGWTKNLFLLYHASGAGFSLGERKLGRLPIALARIAWLDLAPVVFALAWPPAWLLVAARHVHYAWRLRKSNSGAWSALLLIPGSAITLALLANSVWRHTSGQRIAWKGREYASWSS
jgi:glycosyltransferase involved in cell wall biosynthesis